MLHTKADTEETQLDDFSISVAAPQRVSSVWGPLWDHAYILTYMQSPVRIRSWLFTVPPLSTPLCTSGLDWRGARQRVWLAAWQQTRVLAEGGGIKPLIWIRVAGVGLEVGGGGHKDESGNCASAAVGLREHRQERSRSSSQPPPSPIPSVSLISRALPFASLIWSS